MTHIEKLQLCRRIQKLPPKALDRVVEIVKHRKPSEGHARDEVHIDLEKEVNLPKKKLIGLLIYFSIINIWKPLWQFISL